MKLLPLASLVGVRFGSWVVFRDPVDGGVRRRVAVRCECGREARHTVHNLRRGASRSCRSCAQRRRFACAA